MANHPVRVPWPHLAGPAAPWLSLFHNLMVAAAYPMDPTLILQELETLASALAIELHYEPLEGQGGLCRYKGKTRLIVNRNLSVAERIHLLSQSLARLPLDHVFIRPCIRELLEHQPHGRPFS